MNGEVIKSFLVGLGFDVDQSSFAKFNNSIKSATLRVGALYASIKAASAGIALAFSKVSEGFEQMGYEMRLVSPTINKVLLLRQEMLRAYGAAGVNITKVVQQSVLLNFSLTKTKYALEAIYKSVASRFFPLLTKQSDLFRQKLYANMPKIQDAMERFVRFVFKAFEATVTIGERLWSILGRVYEFFKMLDDKTEGWSTKIIGFVAAWKLLNLSFLATPFGMLLSGLVAILALYDDFKTFQEGGKSFFNWSSALPVINAIQKAVSRLAETLGALFQIVFATFDAFKQLFSLNFSGFWNAMTLGTESRVEFFEKLFSSIKGLVGLGGALADWGSQLFGDNTENASANLSTAARPTPSPIGSSVQNSLVNQNVDQQTSITIQGSADANATARAVGSEMTRVNFDTVRNMKGAVR